MILMPAGRGAISAAGKGAPANLVLNGGFDTTLAGPWIQSDAGGAATNGSTIVDEGTAGHSTALRLWGNTTAYPKVIQTISGLTASHLYSFSVDHKVVISPAGGRAYVRLTANSDGSGSGLVESGDMQDITWTNYATTFTAPATTIYVMLLDNSGFSGLSANTQVYFDNVSMLF